MNRRNVDGVHTAVVVSVVGGLSPYLGFLLLAVITILLVATVGTVVLT